MASVIKRTVLFVSVSALACSSIDGRIDANSFDSVPSAGVATGAPTPPRPGAESDSPAADCPVFAAENAGQTASVLWLDGFGEGAATSLASVAINARNDAFMTTEKGGTVALATDGAFLWSKPFGSLVAVDAAGNVFLAGSFRDSLTVDSFTLTSAGGSDVFVVALDASGQVRRSVVLGGAEDETVTSLAVAADGRAFISGSGLGTVALDAEGNIAWQVPYAGQLAAGAGGSLVVTGGFTGTADFGGGPLVSAGGSDIFVVKLDGAGEHLWSARYGDEGGAQEGQAIAVDSAGNILVAGVADGTVDFGLGPLSPASCPAETWCEQVGFALKLGADGSALFSRSTGPMRELSGVALTSSGVVLLSGSLPGDAEPYRMPRLTALHPNGDLLWERQEWPETGLGGGHGVAVDRCNEIRWAVSARPTFDANERAYLAKLAL